MADDHVDEEQFNEEDIIRYYLIRGFSYEEIRRFLQKDHATEISISTLKRRIKSYGLRRKQVEYDIAQAREKLLSVSLMVMIVCMVIGQYGTPYG